jgi:hypothetical protein
VGVAPAGSARRAASRPRTGVAGITTPFVAVLVQELGCITNRAGLSHAQERRGFTTRSGRLVEQLVESADHRAQALRVIVLIGAVTFP